jgi:hypothetical protein
MCYVYSCEMKVQGSAIMLLPGASLNQKAVLNTGDISKWSAELRVCVKAKVSLCLTN